MLPDNRSERSRQQSDFKWGRYDLEINGSGQSDLIHATATATVVPGTTDLNVIFLPGIYAATTTYTFITADGGVTPGGSFLNVTGNQPAFKLDVQFLPNSVILTLMPPPIILIYTPAFSNPNTEAVSKNISITAPTSTFVNNYLMPLVSQPVNVIGNAFNRLQPSQYSAFYEQSIELTTFLASMFHASSLSYCCCNPEKKVLCRYETPNIWAQPYRYTFRLHPYDFQIPAFRSDNNGFILGFDYPVIDGWLVGCGGAYNNDLMLWTDNVGKASLNSGFLSLYTEWTNDRFFCGMLAMGGMDSIHLDRQIQYLTVNQTAKSFRRGYDVVGQWKAGAIFEPYGFVLCPYFKLNYLYFHQNNTVEHGADGADLIVSRKYCNDFCQ